jgi:molecular chaperone GrpE
MEEETQKLEENQEIEEENQEKPEENYLEVLQRLQAEFANYQKRTQKEKEDLAKYAKEDLILKLLEVTDNFQRAVECIEDKESEMAKGISMIFNQFKGVLESEGVTEIKAKGEKFNPYEHEALAKEESEDEENTVTEEFQKGYKLKEKVIRPAKVKVSGGKQK